MVGIGDLPGGSFESYANDVSADGGVVVGYGRSASAKPYEAFRWTSGGMVGLGGLSGVSFTSVAGGISADGITIVGSSSGEAFRWTSAGGMVGLGELPFGGFNDGARAVSADGSAIVGTAFNFLDYQAFRWSSGSGMVSLGFLSGGTSEAQDVSGDGSVVVGNSGTLLNSQAFLWHASLGMVNLKNYLTDHDVAGLTGWTLTDAEGVSADGRTIVGRGINPQGQNEAWIATVPEPSSFTLALSGLGVLWWSRTRRQSFAARGKHGQ